MAMHASHPGDRYGSPAKNRHVFNSLESVWLEDPTDSSGPGPYNYNFYIIFGKKLIDYADMLSRQPLIPLAPSALGELDYFSRRMTRSLVQLYEAGAQGDIDTSRLDVEALEGDEP